MTTKKNALQKANSAIRKADRPTSAADIMRKLKKKRKEKKI